LVYTADYLHVLRRNDLEFNGGELIWLEVIFFIISLKVIGDWEKAIVAS
jgi:hypothetical protein